VFFGGLLTTCGLTYFGDPGRDGDEELGLHGRYSAQSARSLRIRDRVENVGAAARIGEALEFSVPDRTAVGLDYLHSMTADAQGYTRAAMVNRRLGLGLSLRYHTASLPFLNEWKMLNEVDYVVGFEPVNAKIVNRSILRAQGRLPMLEPGEQREMDIEIGFLEGKEEIDAFAAEVQRILAR
jgi:hypothetical protein